MDKRSVKLLLSFILILIFGNAQSDQPEYNKGNNGNFPLRVLSNPNRIQVVDSKLLDANQISTWFRSNGSFNLSPQTQLPGFEWPKGSNLFARFASGLWLGCIVGNDTLTAVAAFAFDYAPGYVDDNGNPQGENDDSYRIYKIIQGNTTDPDYINWPVNQGAYVDSLGNPLNLGTQTMFYVYTDAYTHNSGQSSLASMKAQILQTNWAYNVNGPLGNIVFQEYRIINRSDNVWTQTYLSQWTDDDVGFNIDDKIGCDTNLNLGYTYNATNNDQNYGTAPPAVGFDFFRGALVETGNVNDTVSYFSPPGSNNQVVKVGYRDIGLSVFNYYNNTNPEPSDPGSYIETYRVIEGKWRLGDYWVTPEGDTTRKCFTGDPVANTGWLNPGQADRRFVQSTGPFIMSPGDTQIIVVAQVIDRGSSNLESVRSLRNTDALAQRIFDGNFQVPASAPEIPTQTYAPGNGIIYISWRDTAEKISIPNKLTGSYYVFQGYNVYQIKPGTNGSNISDRILMATYDIDDGTMDILDSVFNQQYGSFIYYVVQKGYDNGISRYFVMNRDYVNNTVLYNGTQYKVVVTAYYYDSLGGPFSAPKVNETPVTASNILTVTPQNLTPGTTVNYNVGDTLLTDQNDLGTMPIIVDPLSLKSATYTSAYNGTNSNPLWNVSRTIGSSTTVLYQDQADFSGTQDTALIIDGFLLVHSEIRDSGIILDQNDVTAVANGINTNTIKGAWIYEPANSQWFTGPDTNAINTAILSTAKLIKHQFQSRSLGMSWPYNNSFRNSASRIRANGTQFTEVAAGSPILAGGPLRTVQFIFGQPSKAYMYGSNRNVLTTDTSLVNTPYKGWVDVPFSVFAVEDLDSSNGTPRQLNVAFIDADSSGSWNPDGTGMGGFEYTYVLASTYDPNPNSNYTSKNPGIGGGATGFQSMDIMYAWLPRVKTVNGAPLTWTNGDKLTVSPYILTRPDFVPGYPVKYSWQVNGTQIGNPSLAASQMNRITAYPNPYYAGSRLEPDPFNRFIYFSHLPPVCNIYIYSLDGLLVRTIERNNPDPNNSIQQWDLQNFDQIPVASGMYIVYIDAGSLGSSTLKIAIFTPEERIQTF